MRSPAVHVKLIRDDGKPVDAIHVHGYAPPELTRPIEESIWAELDLEALKVEGRGRNQPRRRASRRVLLRWRT